MSDVDYSAAVAVIGMSGRFPGAGSPEQLWSNLMAGRNGIRTLDEEELAAAGVPPAQLADPAYVRRSAALEDVDLFDAGMFGFGRREAELMDPQHRLFLESCWEVLERSGYQPTAMPGRVGVFAGCGHPDYAYYVGPHVQGEPGAMLLMATGNERDSLASRVSYKLGLTGPSIGVQTFCSTSLVAVHLAVQSLLNFECETALAGGAYLQLPQNAGYAYEDGGILSPDGHVRSFDAAARGSVMGSGVCTVALKRLDDALEDGDHIEAVILGSAVNNDGVNRAGYTAPGVEGQADVMRQAMAFAGVRPESIGYVECHATGTQLGDAIELAALAQAFPKSLEQKVVLGSVKPSIGHLDRVSGVTGLVKAAKALASGTLPATPDYENPNPALAAERDRFTVLTEHAPWLSRSTPRRAGVSSFGLGGTNAHVVLEEAPRREPSPRPVGPHLLLLSARDGKALDEATSRLADHLATHPDIELADVAFTLRNSRAQFPVRRAFVCADLEEARALLADRDGWPAATEEVREPALRLPDSRASGQWWAEVRAAAERLRGQPAPQPGSGASADAREADRTAVEAVLTALGCRLAPTGQPAEAAGPEAVRVVAAPEAGGPAPQWLLETLAGLWTAGAAVRWDDLCRAGARRVPLPTYPFQRRSYWLSPPEPGETAAARTGRNPDTEEWLYLPAWRRRQPLPADRPERIRDAGPWLVLASDGLGERIAEQIAATGGEAVVARPGNGFGGDAAEGFTFRPGSAQDASRLVDSLPAPPRSVVQALEISLPGRSFEERQRNGFDTARTLVAALARRAPSQPVEYLGVTRGAADFAGHAPRDAAQAALTALLAVVAQENPGWVCRQLDVAVDAEGPAADASAAAVVGETLHDYAGPVVLRRGERWVRDYEPLPAGPCGEPGPLRPGAHVLIVGGLGHVGMLLARHLTLTRGCKVALTARTELPEREAWQSFLDRPEAPARTRRLVSGLLELEKAGGEVLVLSADVGDPERMRRAIEAAEARFGELDLVVHGAGVSDPAAFGPAHMLTDEQSRLHFEAKVKGFASLEQALGERTVPALAMSSLSAALGGLALGAYAAANAALDTCTLAERAAGGRRWLTVNWDTWCPEVQDPTHNAEFDMSAEEAVRTFDRAVSLLDHFGHLVVSTGCLESRHEQWVVRQGRQGEAGEAEVDYGVRDPRPEMSTPYVAPRPGTEQQLADAWETVLRLEKVGAEDDFFSLGGTSVIAIQLIARVRGELGIPVPVTALLGYPTVRGLAAQIDQAARDEEEA